MIEFHAQEAYIKISELENIRGVSHNKNLCRLEVIELLQFKVFLKISFAVTCSDHVTIASISLYIKFHMTAYADSMQIMKRKYSVLYSSLHGLNI